MSIPTIEKQRNPTTIRGVMDKRKAIMMHTNVAFTSFGKIVFFIKMITDIMIVITVNIAVSRGVKLA